ncbi:MAG: PAS domain-containing sensor histidine kinase [Desulfobacteraceae bacterium]|nr:MAG: PAS domain-containing sensor histidine kinase [Desulfobacteraceae bacterium]
MEMNDKKQTLLPYALLSIFLILATGIVWAGYFYYRLYANQYRLEVERELSSIGELKAGELTQWRRERLADARIFYKNSVFSGLVQRAFENPRDTETRTQLRAWLDQLQAYDQYDRICLLDTQAGERLAIPDTQEPICSLLRQKALETLASGEITIVDFHRDPKNGSIRLSLLVPILSPKPGSPALGVLALDIDPEKYLYPFIKRWPVWSRTAETLLVRREGNEVLYLNDLRFRPHTALNLRFPLEHQDLTGAKAVLGQTGIVEGRDYLGDRTLADIRPIPDSPWFLVARMDMAELYAPLKEKQKIMIALIGALLLLTGTGLGMAWRHQRALYYRVKLKATEALQESEARFRNMFLSHRAVMLLIEPQSGAILDANPAAEQFYGYPLARLHAMNIADINMLPADQVTRERQRALEEKRNYFVFPHRLADGRIRTVEVRSSPFLLKDQPVLFSIIHDITERTQTEEALRESDERYKTLFYKALDGICLADADTGRIIDCNRALAALVERERAELIGRSQKILHPPHDDRTAYSPTFKQHLTDKEGEILETQVVTRTGIVKEVEIKANYLNLQNRKMLQGVFRDITERKRAEEALRKSEEKYRLLVDSTDELIVIAQNGRLKFVNRMVKTLTGFSEQELTTRPFPDFVHPDDRGIVVDNYKRRLKGEVFSNRYTFRLLMSDGSFKWLEMIDVILIDWEGKPATLSFLANITMRKQAEEDLRKSEEKYRCIVELVREGIWALDSQGLTTYVNPRMAEILGYTIEEIMGKRAIDFMNPKEIGDANLKLERRKQGVAEKYEREYVRKDGRPVHTLISVLPLTDKLGAYSGSLAVLTDITERKRIEEEKRNLEIKMQQTQKLESLGVLAGGIAHDFNNLLMVVLGNADLALEDLSAVSPAHPMLTAIKKVALRAAELCKQMLAYAGKGAFSIKPIDLNKLVEEMGHMLEISISKKALLQYDLSKNLPAIRADAAQIRQVVMNLIINASEAIDDRGGIVSIRTGFSQNDQVDLKEYPFTDDLAPGPYVFMEVADTGCGMDSATVVKIFDPFFTTKFTGRGLGLPAVLGIVRSHQGALKIDSTPGQGTTFRILFPAVQTAIETIGPEKNGEETWRGRGLILLADDEEPVRDLCGRMLEYMGFEVVTADNGREALKIFEKYGSRIRCVLLDLTMPHMDGGEAFAELRRLDPGVRVILCSGYNEQTLVNGFFEKGLSGFIQKPYQMNELKMKLKSVLG